MRKLFNTFILATLFSLPFGVTLAFSIQGPGQAATYCQCVEYVKNQAGIPSSIAVGNAKDMINSLPNLGFSRVSPQVGAIVVMQPSFPGADRTYGHVGIVDGIRLISGKTYLNVKAANQIGNRFTDSNCNDVSTIGFGTPIDGRGDISFWKRGSSPAPAPAPAASSSFHSVNFSAVTAPIGINIRTAPSINASLVQHTAGNVRINFDGWQYGDTVPDLWTNKPDARWYRVVGTNTWVSSAVVNGNAPGSKPTP